MNALPILPPVTIIQEQRLEEILFKISMTVDENQERLAITYLMNAQLFAELVNNEDHTFADENFTVQAIKNYNKYLELIK